MARAQAAALTFYPQERTYITEVGRRFTVRRLQTSSSTRHLACLVLRFLSPLPHLTYSCSVCERRCRTGEVQTFHSAPRVVGHRARYVLSSPTRKTGGNRSRAQVPARADLRQSSPHAPRCASGLIVRCARGLRVCFSVWDGIKGSRVRGRGLAGDGPGVSGTGNDHMRLELSCRTKEGAAHRPPLGVFVSLNSRRCAPEGAFATWHTPPSRRGARARF